MEVLRMVIMLTAILNIVRKKISLYTREHRHALGAGRSQPRAWLYWPWDAHANEVLVCDKHYVYEKSCPNMSERTNSGISCLGHLSVSAALSRSQDCGSPNNLDKVHAWPTSHC